MIDNVADVTKEEVVLRPACIEDVEIYYKWVNDENVRRQSFCSELISWEDHKEWFKKKLLLQSCFMFVMEISSIPVGQIRFDIMNNIANIDYSLAASARGKRLGSVLVKKGIESIPNKNNLIIQGKVKRENTASANIFLKLGFDELNNRNEDIIFFQLSFSK